MTVYVRCTVVARALEVVIHPKGNLAAVADDSHLTEHGEVVEPIGMLVEQTDFIRLFPETGEFIADLAGVPLVEIINVVLHGGDRLNVKILPGGVFRRIGSGHGDRIRTLFRSGESFVGAHRHFVVAEVHLDNRRNLFSAVVGNGD